MEYQVLFEFLCVKYVPLQNLEFHFCSLCGGEPHKKCNKGLVGVWGPLRRCSMYKKCCYVQEV